MTSSFSIPKGRGHWIHMTPSAAKQFQTKRMLGMTHIRIEMDLADARTEYITMPKDMKLVKNHIDNLRQIHVLEFTF